MTKYSVLSESGTLLSDISDPSPHLGFSSSDGSWFDGSSLIEPGQYLGDAAMGDQELSGDVAGSDTHESKLHDPPPNIVRQRSSIDEDSSKLIDSSLT